MNHFHAGAAALAAVVALGAVAAGQGQPGAPPAAPRPTHTQIHITGENPGLRLRDRQGGPVLAEVNFWRVAWSPMGSGHVCYVTTGDGKGPNDLRLALTDNEKLADFVTHETMAKLIQGFETPPYKVLRATFGFTGDTVNERTEICKSDQYNVETTWRGLLPGNYGEMRPPNGFLMQFIIMTAKEGEIKVNGRKLPGAVYPEQGRPNAYLAFAETWRKEPDPFNGTWVLNVAKSTMQQATASKSETIRYRITGDEEDFLSDAVTIEGYPESIKYTARYDDGKAYPFSITVSGKVTNPGAMTMVKKIDLWTRERYNVRDGKPVIASRRVVSKDGKTMTLTILRVDAQGKEVVNETRILEKQP